MALQLRVGLAVPELVASRYFGAGLFAQYGLSYSPFALEPDTLDRNPNDPAIGVDGTDHAVLLGVTTRLGRQ